MNEMLDANCPSCQAQFEVPADLAGKQGRCPNCQTVFMIGGGDHGSVFHVFEQLGIINRQPSEQERQACMTLLDSMRERYKGSEADALALLSTGTIPRNEKLVPAEHAAWSQLTITLLASDIALLLY